MLCWRRTRASSRRESTAVGASAQGRIIRSLCCGSRRVSPSLVVSERDDIVSHIVSLCADGTSGPTRVRNVPNAAPRNVFQERSDRADLAFPTTQAAVRAGVLCVAAVSAPRRRSTLTRSPRPPRGSARALHGPPPRAATRVRRLPRVCMALKSTFTLYRAG